MISEAWAKHRSWFYSAGIAAAITLWLLSGTLGGADADDTAAGAVAATTVAAPQSRVRVRTQTAEEIVRTIVVNGFTKSHTLTGWRTSLLAASRSTAASLPANWPNASANRKKSLKPTSPSPSRS